jgi:ABC-type cobalamin/Fe3+-siderophores transport system ATPase subunit
MITNVSIRNFKKLETISFPLSQSVVIIGPNNSGKSTIFQALCLWEIGVKNFISAYQRRDLNNKGAVSINRRDLLNSPIADARFLWKNRKVTFKHESGHTRHVVLEVELSGQNDGSNWVSKVEFEFSNAESFSCKVVSGLKDLINLYENNKGIHFGFLQPMSGISTSEDKLTQGSIDRKLGEGKTAEVLRNICFEILHPEVLTQNESDNESKWIKLNNVVNSMFGSTIQKPEFIKATGLINLEYLENGFKYDIASGGRGFQQTLLLFAYMFANPNTILLLDEPDAHLEVIRQREAFQKLNEIAAETNSQILIASHSEVVLEEAAEASKVIALIENQSFELNKTTNSQSIKHIKKSLTEIGWEKYYLAKSKGHVIYLEGSSDLQMLLAFASKLHHPIEKLLRKANVDYTSDNVPGTAISRFVSLQEIFPQLKGVALFDRIPNFQDNPRLPLMCWTKRELENYFARPNLLLRHAQLIAYKYPQFTSIQLRGIMEQTISNFTIPAYLNDLKNNWWNDAKLSDEWLDLIFPEFYNKIGLTQDFFKRDYYSLIGLMDVNDIDPEVRQKLDRLLKILT